MTHTLPRTSTAAPAAGLAGRWPILVLLSLAQFMVILDVSVVNVALPDMARDLSLSGAELTWVATAYTVCLGGLMLLGGRLADLLGRRRVFLAGLLTFTAASLLAGLAGGAATILVARAAQGVGAAMLSPAALAILTTTFQGPARHRALAIWGAIGGGGAAVGVLAGGLLTTGPGWAWVFFVNVPVGLLVAVTISSFVDGGRGTSSGRLDVPGALLVTSATAALIFGVVRLGAATPVVAVVALGTAAALYAAFVLVERRSARPLIDLALLRRRPVVAGTAVMLVATALLVSSFFLLSLLLQTAMGLSALETGLVFLPVAIGTVVGAHLAGRQVLRIGPRAVAAAAFTLAAAGLALLSGAGAGDSVWTAVLPGFVLASIALGAALVTATTTALSRVDEQVAGATSGTVNTAHELGAAIGVAAASAIAGIGAGLGVGPVSTGAALWIGAATAAVAALAAPWLLPRGPLPAGDGPRFVH